MTVKHPRPRVKVRTREVYALLEQRNMSQNRLAELSGLTSGYVSMILSGRRSASADARRRIQEALGIDDFDAIFELETVNDG